MIKRIIFIISAVFLTAAVLSAEDLNTDESSMFSGDTMVDTNKVINNTITSNVNQKSVSLTGNIQSIAIYGMTRKYLQGSTNSDLNQWTPAMQGNLFLDIRLTQGVKAFGNIQATYTPTGIPVQHNFFSSTPPYNETLYETNNTTLTLQEFFLDANINNAVYFRVGKQVLQWGTVNFWTPSDLINIQKQSFFTLNAYNNYLEGSYGLKMHIPFGTAVNLYSFLNMTGITKLDDTAFAGKAEFLIDAFQFSGSIWAKKDFHPVYACEFYLRLFSMFDVTGEASFADYDMGQKLSNTFVTSNYAVPYSVTNQFVTKVSLGITKTFDWELKDRISVTAQFYYKSDGYTENLLKNDSDKLMFAFPYGGVSYFVQSDFYAYNWALLTSINEFLNPNLTLFLNAIGNFVDNSFALNPTIVWNPIYDFNISLFLYAYIGDDNTEYTFTGNALAVGMSASLLF